jgi:hypothetical protein
MVAADHPARMATAAGADPLAMADRRGLLSRLVRILAHGAADGVLASMDILEELLVLDALGQEAGEPSMLDGRLLLASLNRGGLAGASWELDDVMTGPTPQACLDRGLDGAKALLRICPEDPGSLRTLEACTAVARELSDLGLPFFLEPLPVRRSGERLELVREAAALTRVVGVAAALGNSSGGLWLKLPWCEDFRRVAGSTTLPILLLGGPVADGPTGFLRELRDGLDAGENVRGTLLGRNVLYPGAADPLALARAVSGMVHRGWSVAEAEGQLGQSGPELEAGEWPVREEAS